VLDAPTEVTATKFTPASGAVPAFCDVKGYVAPNDVFVLRLPARDWNGKFIQVGCGGFCGNVLADSCDPLLARGYACIATDMGHTSTGIDAKWAYDNTPAEIEFAYRSAHVVTLAGKAMTEAFYGKAPVHSYFVGCSTGGREGMVEAERFPWDYDGIISGAPVINETGDAMAVLWNVVSLSDAQGHPLLTAAQIRGVHAAAVARCDRDDGVADGLIGDPRRCGFDPAELQCTASRTDACLTPAQVAAVRKVYGGPVNSRGEKLYTGGALPGSELNWIGQYTSLDAGPSLFGRFMGDFFRYLAFVPDAGPTWKPTDFNWDRDYQRLGMMESLYSGSNPDLRKFKAAGGKLMIYQGWADQSVLPLNIIDFYELAERAQGGPAPTAEFMRLYMIPGMNHCYGGEGAYSIDYLSSLEAWVEQGTPPDVLRSVHPRDELPTTFSWGAPPLPAADVAFARPVYPYPAEPRYTGHGDASDSANYLPRAR
jgi:feruloyl esterase